MPEIIIKNIPKESLLIALFHHKQQEKKLTERQARRLLQHTTGASVIISKIKEITMHDITFGPIDLSDQNHFSYTIASEQYPDFQKNVERIQQENVTIELNTFNKIFLALKRYKANLVEPPEALIHPEYEDGDKDNDDDDDIRYQLGEIGTKTIFFKHDIVPIATQKKAINCLLAVLDLDFKYDRTRTVTLSEYAFVFYKTKMVNILHPLLYTRGFKGVEDFMQRITSPAVVEIALPAFQAIDPTITLEEIVKDELRLLYLTPSPDCCVM